jgi:prepilin-type processing-associated H-X9-DG protein
MSEREHDDHVEDLDATEEEAEDVKGGLLPAVNQLNKANTAFGDGSVFKLNPGANFQQKLGGG